MDRKSFLSLLGLGFLTSCFDEEIEKDMNVKKIWHFWQGGGGFTPDSLSPVLWIDAYSDLFVSTVDNNGTRARGNIIDSATANTGQALATAGTLASKPIFVDGEGWYFEVGAGLTTGTVASYNFIHDGSDFEIWFTYRNTPNGSGTYNRALFTNNGFSSTARGFLFRLNSTAGNNNITFQACNNAAAFISLTATGGNTVNGVTTVRVRRSGNTATIYINGIQAATQTIVLSPGVGDAATVLNVCSATAASANVHLKDSVIINRALSDSEVTNMNARTFASITPSDINVYLLAGDSICAGRGLNTEIAPDLTGAIAGAFSNRFSSNTPDASSWVGKLQTTVNNTMIAENITTQHGTEMRFGKSMGADQELFIIKYGIGSTPLVVNGSVDWNVASASENYVRFRDNAILNALRDLVHVYRRIPIFRGFIWLHGPNDAVIGASGLAWTRSGTTVTVTETTHGMSTGQTIPITVSSDTGAIPLGIYTITNTGANTYTFTGVDTGATSGTLSYSAGSTYKANFTALFNAIINHLNDTIKNEVTNGTGYSTAKLRLMINLTKSGGSGFDATSFTDVVAAQTDIAANYLTDNPSMSARVLASTSVDTQDIPVSDTIHPTAAGNDTLGQRIDDYFDGFINE